MKKFTTFLLFFAILSAGLTACRKEHGENLYDPVDAMHEIYNGKQGEGTEQPNNNLQLNLQDNGSLFASLGNDSIPGLGTWEMTGKSFHATYRRASNNLQVKLEGEYDPATNSIKGTWGYGDFAIGGGSFFAEKEKAKNLSAKRSKGLSMDVLIDRLF